MSKCKCYWCANVFPAMNWLKKNGPEEHYAAINKALEHQEVIETDAAMYRGKCDEIDRLKAELAAAREANAKLRDRNCNDNGCEYVQKAHTMHNALVQALAAKDAELAKLRALCDEAALFVRNYEEMTGIDKTCKIHLSERLAAAGRGEE